MKEVIALLKTKPTHTNAANPITNFFTSFPNGVNNFYTTDGKDILQGTFYRIIVAYKMIITTKEGGWFGIGKEQEKKNV